MSIIEQYFPALSSQQSAQFSQLENLYNEWNEKINVISRKDIGSLYLKHVLHSLTIARFIQFAPRASVIDIGTGGGFPGIPLAIYFPEVEFLLVDSIGKKLKVVQDVAAQTGLKNVQVRHIRAEEIKDKKFDFAVTRAVAPLQDLIRWSRPLIKKSQKNDIANGLISLKGGDLSQEIYESDATPLQIELSTIFKEEYFTEKYLLHCAL